MTAVRIHKRLLGPGGRKASNLKRSIQFATTALLLALALPLCAQTSKVYREGNAWVEEITGTVPAARSLRINTDVGAVNVTGGSQRDVTYTVRKRVYVGSEEEARRQLARFRVRAGHSADSALIEGSWEEGSARKFSADFQVQTPRETDLVRISTDGGAVGARNISGRVEAETGGGAVTVSDIGGAVSVETGGGVVSVNNCPGPLGLHTGGGAISVSGSAGRATIETGGGAVHVQQAAQASVETGGGDVDVRSCGGELHASTGGGNIDVGDVAGRASLETGGGNIHLASATGPVVAETGGGGIELYKLAQGAKAETGAGGITAEFLGVGPNGSTLETSAGHVIVYLSPQAKVTLRATLEMANGHRISSDFPDFKITTEGGDWGPKNVTASGNLNGGGPVLRVRTMSGDIEIRRANR